MRKILILWWSLLLSMTVFAQDETVSDSLVTDSVTDVTLATDTLPFPQNIQHRLDSMIAVSRTLQHSQLGLMVYDLTADSAVYTYNHRQTMRPASVMKLVTAIAAIDRLGGSYQLRTSLCYKGKIENRTLNGSLYCVGGMDPRFNSDDLTAFIESLLRLDIDTIRGQIVSDRSFKEKDLLGEGWCWDDDNPVLTPLLLNRKDNLVERLIERLTENGMTLAVTRSEGALPTGAQTICTRTHTIEQVLSKMLKESDNLYAEAMFYQLAAAGGARPAKASHAREAVKKLIQKNRLTPSAYRIADGSGLSLYNYVSPELLTRLLRYAWRNSNISEYLIPALPIAGVDGTLKNRMKNTAAEGNVHAKTGTLTGISSLAGYCTAPNGHILSFVIINQGVLRNSDGRTFQDRVCNALCKP